MLAGWSTVWEIAGRRNETKRGKDHLTIHAFDVLQYNVQREQQEAMAAAINSMGLLSPRRGLL